MLKHMETTVNNTLIIVLEGRLDSVTTPQLTAALENGIEQANEVVFDLKEVDYISSAGLRLLLSTHKKMMGKGGMVLRNVNEMNMEILELTGFTEIFTIE